MELVSQSAYHSLRGNVLTSRCDVISCPTHHYTCASVNLDTCDGLTLKLMAAHTWGHALSPIRYRWKKEWYRLTDSQTECRMGERTDHRRTVLSKWMSELERKNERPIVAGWLAGWLTEWFWLAVWKNEWFSSFALPTTVHSMSKTVLRLE
jgi:hypothetical protein